MGMVVVISLPLILFCFLLGFGCYFFGRARGRRDVFSNPQVYGMPIPPPGAAAAAAANTTFPSPHSKPNFASNV